MQNLRFDAALNNMSQGLCMFDGEQSWSSATRPTRACTACRPSWSQPGTPFTDIIKHRLATGLHVEQSPDDYMRDLREIIAEDRPATKIRELSDGRIIAIKHQPMPDERLARPRTRTSPSIAASRRAWPTWRTTTS